MLTKMAIWNVVSVIELFGQIISLECYVSIISITHQKVQDFPIPFNYELTNQKFYLHSKLKNLVINNFHTNGN